MSKPLVRALAVLALLSPSLAPPPARAEDAPSFVKDGRLTMCTDPTYAPMEFFEHQGDREPVGFDIDLARALATRWRATLRILSMDFSGLLPGVTSGRCDMVLSGTFITPERLQAFSGVPYLMSSMVILGPASAAPLANPDALAGSVLAVEAGTQYEKRAFALKAELQAAGARDLLVQAYPGGAQAVQQVATGRAAAVLTQDTEAAYRAIAQPGQFKVLYTYPDKDAFGVYFAKNAANAALVRRAIDELRSDGTIGKIGERWRLPASDLSAPLPPQS